ncbi:hypothetical protein SNOUR_08485 [Streptomyces noursei ATCC 11455]|uniref:EF-hand domain pair n=1 Tax=Streptomyces yunnanensis TaxID=156453 RepID=A0A9X8QZA3_9ACTN|nr:hypothetical protein SNOUR_08485 [Streptomyces noursei ATCC 11455]SHN21210.1 EF-hand domain pair [Streptomyces yunnanensis]
MYAGQFTSRFRHRDRLRHDEGAPPVADIEQAKATFAKFDADGDGRVTPDEFKSAMAAMGDHLVTGPMAEAVIKAKDSDGDGLMSFDEFWKSVQG